MKSTQPGIGKFSVHVAAVMIVLLAWWLFAASSTTARSSRLAPRDIDGSKVDSGRETPPRRVVSAVTREGRLVIFDDVWQTIRERYYDSAFHGVDWERLGQVLRPVAAAAGDERELYTLLRRMIGVLQDAHTRVYAPGERLDWRRYQHSLRFVNVGVNVRNIAGVPIVSGVERDSEAARKGVRSGDTVVSVDGEPASTIIQRRMAEASRVSPATVATVATVDSLAIATASANAAATSAASAVVAQRRALSRLFDGPPGSVATVVFAQGGSSSDGDGDDNGGGGKRQKTLRLRRVLHTSDTAPLLAPLRVNRVAGDYRVIHFDAFTEAHATQFARALAGEDLSDAPGLILDLRNNGGGEAEAMLEVASALLPVGKSLGYFVDRNGRVASDLQTRSVLLFSAAKRPSFTGAVVILTSPQTASATEIFVQAMKQMRPNTVVIGENTCGCVLGIRRPHILPDGGELDVSEMDFRTSTGVRLEARGVTPDEMITPTLIDVRAKRDTTLRRAIELLQTNTTRRR